MMITLHFQRKGLIDIDIAKLRKSRKFNRIKSLNFAANLGLNKRLNRDIRISKYCGAFKICKYLIRTF